MKRVCFEHNVYLELRSAIQNKSQVRDYQQIVGEHALIMIDMLHAMHKEPVRVADIAHLGGRIKDNSDEWKMLLLGDGVHHTKEWKNVCKNILAVVTNASPGQTISHTLQRANNHIMDYVQVGQAHNQHEFLRAVKEGPGRALGHLCALGVKWKPHVYDDVVSRIQGQWCAYVSSIVSMVHAIRNAKAKRKDMTDETRYSHCARILMCAQSLGREWDEGT